MPIEPPPNEAPLFTVVAAIIQHGGRVLICQRRKGDTFGLKWEFPGGKLEPGETFLHCLQRELQEELSIKIGSVERVEFQTARYDDGGHFSVAYCYISDFDGEPKNNVFEEIRWVEPRELAAFDILEGNKEIIAQLTHE